MAAESELEKNCKTLVELGLKGKLLKVQLIARNGWPDREMLIPGCPTVYIEMKSPGKPLRSQQKQWRDWLTDNGFIHWKIDSWGEFQTRVRELVEQREEANAPPL